MKRLSKKKLDRSPSPNEDVIRRRLWSKRRRWVRSDDVSKDGVVMVEVRRSKPDEEEPVEGSSVEVFDRGLDSDEQCSLGDGFAPARLDVTAAKKQTPPTGLCAACLKLYQRAKKLKTPTIDKLLDNDPTSLTCDQWVLLKVRRPRRTPQSRRALSPSLLKIQRHVKGKKKAKQRKHDEAKSLCSRPHIFLKRNLRRPRRAPVTKKGKVNQRKRPRDDSRGPGTAKQRGFKSSRPSRDSRGDCSNDSSFDSFHSGEHEQEDSFNTTANLSPSAVGTQNSKLSVTPPRQKTPRKTSPSAVGIQNSKLSVTPPRQKTPRKTSPSAVGMQNSKLSVTPPRQKMPRKAKGFRELLAQLRGNSSMVVKETH